MTEIQAAELLHILKWIDIELFGMAWGVALIAIMSIIRDR